MMKLMTIALAVAALASPAYGDKSDDLKAAVDADPDEGCLGIPAFYKTERNECTILRRQSDDECKVHREKLSCDEGGPIRNDLAMAEKRAQRAEADLARAKSKQATAKPVSAELPK